MEGHDWLSTAEAAALIGTSRQSVTRWIRDGKLRARRIQVGERAIYRIDRRELASFARRYIQDL